MGQGEAASNADGKKGPKGSDKVILKVDMDCEACKNKVRKVLKKFPGVDNIELDTSEQKVTVTGKLDALEIYEAVKKCKKRTTLVYPEITQKDREDAMIKSINKIVNSITDLLTPKAPDTTLELKVNMHCGACAKQIKKMLLKLDGVTEVNEDLSNDKVVVKGRGLVTETICERIRRVGKHCEVVLAKKEGKTDSKEGSKEKAEEKSEKQSKNIEEKKEGKKKGENDKKDEKKQEVLVLKEEKVEERKQDEDGETVIKMDSQKYVHPTYNNTVTEYMYPPEIFSDENPNACSIM